MLAPTATSAVSRVTGAIMLANAMLVRDVHAAERGYHSAELASGGMLSA